MKKFLSLFLSAALLLALLCACTADNPGDAENPSAGTGASASPTGASQEPSLALPSEGPSEGPSPESSAVPNQEPSEAPATQAPATQAPATQAPATQAPATQAPATQAPATQAPATQAPATQAPATQAPATQAPATQAPATQAPATQAPATQAPATQAPATQAPATQAPATQAPESQAPESSPGIPGFPGGVVIPGFGGGGLGGGGAEASPSPSQSAGGDVCEPTGPSASDVDLEAFLGSLINDDNYAFPTMDVLSNDWIINFYPGLVSVPVVQRWVCTPSMSGVAAEITLVQVSDSSDVSTVESILQARIDNQVNGGAYYLPTIEQWEFNSRIVKHGNYIMLIVHSSCDDIVADFNALF